MRKIKILSLAIVGLLFVAGAGWGAADELPQSKGQLIYVPACSNIYISNGSQRYLLTVTLILRNADMKHAITLQSVDYFDGNGKILKKYLDHPVDLNAFGTKHFVVQQKDDAGGVGAKFLVQWKSDIPVNIPIIESVMIGAEGQQGISFSSRGVPITNNK